jgi:hypothetical protein
MWDDNLNYSFFTTYLAAHKTLAGSPGFDTSDFDAAHTASGNRGARSVVDAALVLDTTGSMGDEISYITAEFSSISGAVAAAYPDADQRWALVVYSDHPDTDPGDEYIVKHHDFTGDVQTFAATVAAQTANGGGDYPLPTGRARSGAARRWRSSEVRGRRVPAFAPGSLDPLSVRLRQDEARAFGRVEAVSIRSDRTHSASVAQTP